MNSYCYTILRTTLFYSYNLHWHQKNPCQRDSRAAIQLTINFHWMNFRCNKFGHSQKDQSRSRRLLQIKNVYWQTNCYMRSLNKGQIFASTVFLTRRYYKRNVTLVYSDLEKRRFMISCGVAFQILSLSAFR